MELNSQVYIPPSVVWKGEKVRMISIEPLITNTLDESSVSDMVTEPLFQTAVAVLQQRTSGSPTVAWWLLPLMITRGPSMVTTGPAALHLAAELMSDGNV